MANRTLDLSIGTSLVGTRWRIEIGARMTTPEDVEKVIHALEVFRPLLVNQSGDPICVDESEI